MPLPGYILVNERVRLYMTNTPETYVATDLTKYVCERCGFEYHKVHDYAPFLCYRCMRFIAKRVFVTMNTITPPNRTEVGDV